MRPTIILLIILGWATAQAQNLTGRVADEAGQSLIGATLYWSGTQDGVVTDENGQFEIFRPAPPAFIVVQYVGYATDTLFIPPDMNEVTITLYSGVDLQTVEVKGESADLSFSTLQSINVETIGSGELKKAACCTLAESFETNASVDVSYSDALTGSREIQMLGLRGVYAQMLMEKRPIYSGLASLYGLDFIPGTWLESIQLTKGAGSVQTGYQSITGQINTEIVKPRDDKPLFVNLYGNIGGRGEANIHLNRAWNDQWATGLLLHGSVTRNDWDHDGDGYHDMPQKTLLNGMFRAFYAGKNLRAQFNVQALRDEREAGQILPDDAAPTGFYRIVQQNQRLDVFGKIGYVGFRNPNASIGLIANTAWHDLRSSYGNNTHNGVQRTVQANLFYTNVLGGMTHHLFYAGASMLYDDFDEAWNDTDLSRTEKVPGVFVEYTYEPNNNPYKTGAWFHRTGLVAGLRADYHNMAGWLISPRVHLRHNFSDTRVVRLSAGRGYQMANVLASNLGVLASNRQIDIQGPLDIEEAWNMGINYTQHLQLLGRGGHFNADLYHTRFVNQVVMDVDEDITRVSFYNLDGRSFSTSLLLLAGLEVIDGLETRVAYKFTDARTTYVGGERQLPLVARHRGLVTIDYETPGDRWMFNLGAQLVGPQRIPDNSDYPDYLVSHIPEYSPWFTIMNAQVTHRFSKLELYLGGENLLNVRQHHPIIAFEDPFGPYFNASQAYAPTMGTVVYMGLRWWI